MTSERAFTARYIVGAPAVAMYNSPDPVAAIAQATPTARGFFRKVLILAIAVSRVGGMESLLRMRSA